MCGRSEDGREQSLGRQARRGSGEGTRAIVKTRKLNGGAGKPVRGELEGGAASFLFLLFQFAD